MCGSWLSRTPSVPVSITGSQQEWRAQETRCRTPNIQPLSLHASHKPLCSLALLAKHTARTHTLHTQSAWQHTRRRASARRRLPCQAQASNPYTYPARQASVNRSAWRRSRAAGRHQPQRKREAEAAVPGAGATSHTSIDGLYTQPLSLDAIQKPLGAASRRARARPRLPCQARGPPPTRMRGRPPTAADGPTRSTPAGGPCGPRPAIPSGACVGARLLLPWNPASLRAPQGGLPRLGTPLVPLAEKPLSAVLARSAGRGRRGGGSPGGGPREGAGRLIGLGLWWMLEGPPGLPLRRAGSSCCGSFTSGSAWRNSIALVLGHSGLNPSAGGGGSTNCSKRPDDPERPDLCSHEQQVREIITQKVRK